MVVAAEIPKVHAQFNIDGIQGLPCLKVMPGSAIGQLEYIF